MVNLPAGRQVVGGQWSIYSFTKKIQMKQFRYKKFLSFSSIVLTLSILFLQCRKNEDVTINEPYQPVYISGGVYGNVVNNNGDPEPNVKVSNGTNSVLTDQNGVFILKNQLLDKAGAQIKFEKAGYYTIYKSVIPIKNKMVFTKLQLVPKKLTKVINSVTGDVIVANGNAQLTISTNSIADANGNLFSGQVQVFAYWMDPSSDNTNLEMPGNLTGRDKDGKEVCLQTLGMMAVELEDLAGNPLNIATGKFAEIKLPIPSSLDAQAKSTIPLWYYNTTKGGWIEEGVASRQGNFYVGQVQHFSFWNCDFPRDVVNLKGRVLDVSGKAIGNVLIEIKDEETGQKGYGWTTSDGYFEGKIPAASTFVLTVVTYQCQSPFDMNFTTTTSELDLGNINTTIQVVRLFGTINDCSDNHITSGYFQVWFESKQRALFFLVDATGNFDGNIIACINQELKYKVIDITNLKQSDENSVTITNLNEYSFGTLKACEELTNIIVVNTNGTTASYINAVCETVGNELRLFGSGFNGRDSSYVSIKLSAIDLNNLQNPLSIELQWPIGKYYYCSNCFDMFVKVTEYGAIGAQVKGTFNGKLREWITNQKIDFDGEFSVERKQ